MMIFLEEAHYRLEAQYRLDMLKHRYQVEKRRARE